MSATQEHDGVTVRIDIFARYNEAVLDRPLKVNAALEPESSAQIQEVEDFQKYGTPVQSVPAALEASLPGGFTVPDGAITTVTLLPTADQAEAQDFDLVVADREGCDLSSVTMAMQSPSWGTDGAGAWAWEGSDVSSVLRFGIKHDPEASTTEVWTRTSDISGTRPAEALKALTALKSMQVGTSMRLVLHGGPLFWKIEDIPDGLGDPDALNDKLAVCQSLVALQQHIPSRLLIPEAKSITGEEVSSWHDAAALLEGKVLEKTWLSLSMTMESSAQMTLPYRIRTTQRLKVYISGSEWTLGLVDLDAIAATWEPDPSSDLQGRLHPNEEFGTELTMCLVDDVEAQARAESGLVQCVPLVT